MSRNLRENLGLSHDSTSRLERLMNDYIEYALIEVDHGDLEVAESVGMDAKDRHVLAAALSADADILLTDNAKDFPGQWMAEQGMELLATRLVGTCFAGVSAGGKRDQPAAGSQSTHRGPGEFAADHRRGRCRPTRPRRPEGHLAARLSFTASPAHDNPVTIPAERVTDSG